MLTSGIGRLRIGFRRYGFEIGIWYRAEVPNVGCMYL